MCAMCELPCPDPVKVITSNGTLVFCSQECAEFYIELALASPDYERKAYMGRNYIEGNRTKH